jgi:hypothetical protein
VAGADAERRRLDDDLVAALVELRKRQARESEIAGAAYGAGLAELDWYPEGDEYIVTDELGTPLHPESYSDEFTRMLRRAGLPKIRLHDSLVVHHEDLRPRKRRRPESRPSGTGQDPPHRLDPVRDTAPASTKATLSPPRGKLILANT